MTEGLEGIITSLEQQMSAIERALSALRDIEAGAGSPPTAPQQNRVRTASSPRGGITPEGRKRLAEAMKRRWAVKRTGAQAKKSARKRAA